MQLVQPIKRSRSEAVARWLVLVLFLFLPFFFVPAEWISIAQAKIVLATIIAVVALLAWIVFALSESRFYLSRSLLFLGAFLVPIAYLVSALATGASWESFFGNGRTQDTVMNAVIWVVLLFLVVAIMRVELGRMVWALRLFLAGSTVVLFVQIIHLLIPSFTFGGALTVAPSSVVNSWHDLGILLGLVLFVSLALTRTSVAAGAWRFLAITNALFAGLFLLIINYSDVWLGLFFLSLFFVFALYRTRLPGQSIFRISAVYLWFACALLALGLYFGGTTLHGFLPQRLQVTQIEVRPSWQGTLAIGQNVFAEPSRIFFGSGPSTFSREWGLYKPLSVNTTQFWNVDFYHGVGFIPTSLVTTGILGIFAWSIVCLGLLWSVWRWFWEAPTTNAIRAVLVGSALYLTVFHILYVPGPMLSIMTFLVYGMLIAHELYGNASRAWAVSLSIDTWAGRGTAALVSLFGLVVLFGGVQSVRAIASDALVNRAVSQYATTQDLEAASRSVALAVMILPNNDRAHRAGVELGFLQLSQMMATSGGEESQEKLQAMLTSTIEHGLTAISIEDRNYQNWLALARLYSELAGVGVAGAEQSAREAYVEVQLNNPTSPLPYLGLAQLDLINANDNAARVNLEVALQIKPDIPAAHFLLSQIHARAEDFGSAEEHASVVVQIAPGDPLGWYNLGTILYAREDYERAALALERAVAIQNNYANALFLLGLSYGRLDMPEDALAALRVVADLNPTNATVAQIIASLEAGEDLDLFSR